MDKLWFRRKRYGYGWTPCSIEGWTTTLVFVLFIIFIAMKYAETDQVSFFSYLVLSIIALIFITYKKGEKPKWQLGKS